MYDDNLFLNGKLPEKLNKKDTIKYFEECQKGNQCAREELILHNIKLVIYRINSKFSKFSFDVQEMFSAGMIGLINSIDTFDLEKGYEFSSYAIRCIDNAIYMFVRKEIKHLEVDSLDRTIATDQDGKNLKIEDIILDDTVDLVQDYEKSDQIRILKNLMEDLSEEDSTLLNLYFKDRLTQQNIADQYHFSRSNVSRKIRQIIGKLAKDFNEYNEADYQNRNGKKNITCEITKCNKNGKYLSKKLDMNSSK